MIALSESRGTVLVADDDPAALVLIQSMLTAANYLVLAAPGRAEATPLCRMLSTYSCSCCRLMAAPKHPGHGTKTIPVGVAPYPLARGILKTEHTEPFTARFDAHQDG